MISLHSFDMSAQNPIPPPCGPLDAIAEFFMSSCEFCGIQHDEAGKPLFELWTIRKPVFGLTVKSTYTRETIEKALRRSKYGQTIVEASKDFGAVEKPATP